MEKLRQLRQTLREVDDRVPMAFRVACTPAPGPDGDDAGVADFAASLLAEPVGSEEHSGHVAEPESQSQSLRLDLASCYVPLHDHDAHFGDADAGVLGVADGVGGYMDDGVDAGAFARGLMASAAAEAAAAATPACPYALLERAYNLTVASRATGASTAVILSLDAGHLRWAYVGDSGFAVLRGGRTVFMSDPQQDLSSRSKQKLLQFRHNRKLRACPAARRKLYYSFRDPPLQLSATGGDPVTEAKTYAEKNHAAVPVMAGDVVVAATDGLFNNLTEEQLQRVVCMGSRLGFSPKNMADLIVGVAYERSKLPFSTQLVQGKPDDITVVVAFVVRTGS